MLLCETGGTGIQDTEDLAVLASQLAAAGVAVQIDGRALPPGLGRNALFDLAPYLAEGAVAEGDRLLVVGAERLGDERLLRLRRLVLPPGTPCLALGAFTSAQGRIGARSRLAYALGEEAEVLDLAAGDGGIAHHGGLPVFGVPRARRADGPPRVLLVAPDLTDRAQAAALHTLARSRNLRVAVLTDGRAKEVWIAGNGPAVPVYHYGEALPVALAERVDVCAVFATLPSYYRVRVLLANLALAGAALLDGTRGLDWTREIDAFLPGPGDVAGLGPFLAADILPNLEAIAERTRETRSARDARPEALLRLLGAPAAAREPARPAAGGIVFMPTNGIGLGHAQRCTLIARDLDRSRRAVFAAFPSCLRLVKSHGFDAMPLIGRSSLHAQPHENDLVNYLRLSALTEGAATLVFDGVYVFDSVYRSILENGLTGVWIRRGLWQPGQDNAVALDREKVFDRVIVPAEAFAELNHGYSRGAHLHEVGPIVQRAALAAPARQALRERLAERFGRHFDRLVLSLLGAGVAADRSAQVQAICGIMERRPDCLHLVVIWPSAVTQPGWFAWANSRVVKTHHAATLAAAADLCISAAGYNSLHEALYNRVPTLFVPQVAPGMDDQQARADAAVERGVAATVGPEQLMALDREIGRLLDRGGIEELRRALAGLELPEPGNVRAARLIEEVTDGRPALDLAAWPRDARGGG